jgi:hypothetical protein
MAATTANAVVTDGGTVCGDATALTAGSSRHDGTFGMSKLTAANGYGRRIRPSRATAGCAVTPPRGRDKVFADGGAVCGDDTAPAARSFFRVAAVQEKVEGDTALREVHRRRRQEATTEE